MKNDDAPFSDAIILAAGSSVRMGGPDKLRMEVGGLPLLAWTVFAAAQAATVGRIIVVSRTDRGNALADEPWIRTVGASVVVGGARRQDSVAAGVEASDGEVVLIHDGARPLVHPALFDRVALAAREHGAAVPVVPVPESMRRVVDGQIVGILDKIDLYRSQTPHGARREVILRAYACQDPRGPETFIDETALVQSTGQLVSTVPGDPANLKVCRRGEGNVRMMVETVLSMLTLVCHFKKVMHRVWRYFEMRLGWTMAAFNILAQWHGLEPDKDGIVHLSIAEFSL